jgi:hypothetical protein
MGPVKRFPRRGPRTVTRRVIVALLACAGPVLMVASPAFAHAELLSTDPVGGTPVR